VPALSRKQTSVWNVFAAAALTTNPGVTLGNTIYLDSHTYSSNFANASVADQSTLVHEVTHVWQGQTNPDYSAASAAIEGIQGFAAYQYTLDPSNPSTFVGPPRPLTSYTGFEQQAQIVQDYYLNGNGLPTIGNQDRTTSPGILNDAYLQTLGSSGLGPAAPPSSSSAPPGNQTLPGQTQPPASGGHK
jgi:hypothetical protein